MVYYEVIEKEQRQIWFHKHTLKITLVFFLLYRQYEILYKRKLY